MGRYDFDWHDDYYRKVLRDMAKHAFEKCGDCSGWLVWFMEQHPEQYEKFKSAILRIHSLWGNMDSKAMDDFKIAVKVEVDATRWAIERFAGSRPAQMPQKVGHDEGSCRVVIVWEEQSKLLQECSPL